LKVPEASYKLASLAMAGAPVQADSPKALEYLAGTGVSGPKALVALGNLYENGVGLAPNYTQAFNWYKTAAEGDLPEAIFRVGTCYEIGLGTPADPKAALAAFEKLAGQKMAAASYKLAGLYIAGELVPVDHPKALGYMHEAADNGHSGSANEMGVIYLKGVLGQTVDMDKALEMFVKAADLGNNEAMQNIAVRYNSGLGRPADPVKALQWYLIAQMAGFQFDSIGEVVAELKKKMKPDQVKKSEEEAEKWVAGFNARKETSAPVQN
jgi:TPR repeat protein